MESASLNKLPFPPEEHSAAARGRGIWHHRKPSRWKPSCVLGQMAQALVLSAGACCGVSGLAVWPYGQATRPMWSFCRHGAVVCVAPREHGHVAEQVPPFAARLRGCLY